jgi:putative peptidoglycan lipid II flippase
VSIRTSFFGLVALTLLGQGTLLAYEIVLTRRFGTTPEADALALAFMVAFALANEVAGWVGTLLIPRYLETEAHDGPNLAGGFLSAILLATSLTAATLLGGMFVIAPSLSSLLSRGPAVEGGLLRLFLPLVALVPVAAVLANALQARDRFGLAALRPVLWYGAALVAVLVAADAVGPAAVPVGMTAGLVLYTLMLAMAVQHLIRQATVAAWKQLRSLAPLLFPLVGMSVANYLQVLVERGLAGHLEPGSLAAVTYAFRLVNAPITLLVLTAATILFPVMSARTVRDGPDAVGSLVGRALRASIVLTIPSAGLLMVSGDLIVQLLFERGAFTPRSSHVTALALFYYAPALVGLTTLQLLIRAYWALRRIGLLACIHFGVAAFGVVAMVSLTSALGFRGLPIAVSLASLVHSVSLLVGLRSQSTGLAVRPIVGLTGRAGAAALLAVLAAAAVRAVAGGLAPQLGFGLAAGATVYVVLIGRLAPLEWTETLRLLALRR